MVNNKMELLLVQLREALDLDGADAARKVTETAAEKLRQANKAKADMILRTIKMGLSRNNG